MKKIVILLLLLMLYGCSKSKGSTNPQVQIILDDDRVINLELYPEKAPKTVENFLQLVDQNYYDGLIFHRIIANFMIQGGGYYLEGNTILEKKGVETIYGEFANNGFTQNDLKHEVGVISMARTPDKNSASSQFFICSADVPHLDGDYAAFGKTLDEASKQVVVDLSFTPTIAVSYNFTDFPYPVVTIKTIKRIN